MGPRNNVNRTGRKEKESSWIIQAIAGTWSNSAVSCDRYRIVRTLGNDKSIYAGYKPTPGIFKKIHPRNDLTGPRIPTVPPNCPSCFFFLFFFLFIFFFYFLFSRAKRGLLLLYRSKSHFNFKPKLDILSEQKFVANNALYYYIIGDRFKITSQVCLINQHASTTSIAHRDKFTFTKRESAGCATAPTICIIYQRDDQLIIKPDPNRVNINRGNGPRCRANSLRKTGLIYNL